MRDSVAERIDVVLNLRILDHRKLRVDLLRFLLAHLNFLLSGDPAPGEQRDCADCNRDIPHRVPPRKLCSTPLISRRELMEWQKADQWGRGAPSELSPANGRRECFSRRPELKRSIWELRSSASCW